jgi:hypothetical protein
MPDTVTRTNHSQNIFTPEHMPNSDFLWANMKIDTAPEKLELIQSSGYCDYAVAWTITNPIQPCKSNRFFSSDESKLALGSIQTIQWITGVLKWG